MSRALTSAQVIEKGDYLAADFDPNTLTISQLLGVFGFHNINFPSPYSKGKLVQIFNDELKPNAKQYKKERLSRQNSQASDDGITDGVTGRPINEGRRAPTTRMVTRRASRAPSELVVEPEPVRPEPVKRRRSSAEPRLGGPSRRRTTKPVEPDVAEESEPEEPVRKVSRSKKKTEEAGARARRVSQSLMEDPDSGWEDNNIFQSGAESSSPARPSPVRRTRRSAIPRARKSLSVPPEFAPPPSPPSESPTKIPRRRTSARPPESNFEPVLPPEVARPKTKRVTRSRDAPVDQPIPTVPEDAGEVEHEHEQEQEQEHRTPDVPETDAPSDIPAGDSADQAHSGSEAVSDGEPAAEDLDAISEAIPDSLEEDEQVRAVSQRIADGGNTVARRREGGSFSRLVFRFVMALLASGVFFSLGNYKSESASIGFCDTGKKTNDVLEGYRARRALVQECNRENRTMLYPQGDGTDSVLPPTPEQTPTTENASPWAVLADACPPPPLLPIPLPDSCELCPAHATCTVSTMTCDAGYLLRPHPLVFFLSVPRNSSSPNTYTAPAFSPTYGEGVTDVTYSAIQTALNGLPGFGPVALPPRCVENPRRKRHIGALGKAMESMLAAERGRRLCSGVGWEEEPGTEAQEAKKWGLEVEALKENMRKKTSPQLLPAFEDTFNEAIQQLVVWGGVFVGEDADGKRYLAHHTASMDWTCTLKVKARESWSEWRNQILGFLTVLTSMLAFRRRRARNLIENDRVGELVQIALDLLRNQEIAHHTDPVTAPQPYLSSLQLRDLILQDEHSVGARNRLWHRVETIVESNSNVRTNLEEVEGGDEMRVWRWVGSAGPLSPGRTPSRPFPYTPQKEAST